MGYDRHEGCGGHHGPPPGMFLAPFIVMGLIAAFKRARCAGAGSEGHGPPWARGRHGGPPWARAGHGGPPWARREWIEERLEEWHRKAHEQEGAATPSA